MNIIKLSQTGFILCAGLLFGLVSSANAALLMHLPLDGNLNDISGNGNNGVFQGGSTNPGFAAAVYNQGLNFDGNNDYITVPSFDPGSTFSASLWVNHDNIGALNTFIEHANNGNNRNDFYIGYDNSNNQLTVELEDNNQWEGGACGDPKFCTGIVLNSNRWYHVVVTVTPTTLNIFIDATLAYTTTHSTTVNFGNGSWLLGGDTDSNPVTSANNDYLDGRIDDVRIYNHELSQIEISNLYGLVGEWNFDNCNVANPNDITDSSGNNLHASPINGVTTSTTGKICTALTLDGTNDYAEVADNNLLDISQSLTVMTWIHPNSLPGSGLMSILSKDENYEFHIDSSGRIFWWWNNSSGATRSFNSTIAVSTNVWTHVAIVYEAGSQRIVINGVERGTRNYNETLITNNDPLHFGGDQNFAGREFDGLIDEVKIYNRALTTEEINGYVISPDPLNRTCPTCSGGGSQTIILSTENTETLGGLSFTDGSLAEYDPIANSSTLYFNENLFSGNEDINAVHVLANGIIILSTTGNATLGGLSFGDDDLIAYDPSNNTATLYFDGGALFSNPWEDIDAVYVRDNGNIILSTIGNATLGGLSFSDGDLIEYIPSTDSASLFFDESEFSGGVDIDGVHILANGNILLSTDATESLYGLNNFEDGSIIEVNTSTNSATLYFDENLFSGGADINALTLPPTVATLDHIEFVHDGAAITCNPEPITVKACANADCSSLVSTAVTVDLTPATASSPDITWFDSDSKTITLGSVNLTLQQTVVGNLTLGTSNTSPNATNPVVCKNAAGTVISCTINYVNSGFIFNNETDTNTIIPTQLSGKDSNAGFNAKTITLQAVRSSDSDPAQCLPAFQNKTLDIDFAAECSNPVNCVAGQLFNLTSAAVTGNLTATTNDNGATGSSSYDTRTVIFDVNGKINIIFNYPEAGLMELHARHNILLPDGITPSGNYMSGSSSFVVRPLGLSLDVSGQRAADYLDDGSLNNSTGSDLSYSADASGSAFTNAGVDFVTSVTAVQWQAADDINNDGIADAGANLTNNTTTTNFGKETTAIIPADVIVTHLTSSPNQGTFTNPANDANFTNGVANKTFNWNEVGIIDLTATLTNYLGAGNNIVSGTADFGRFTPDHFDTLVTHACNNFTYSGQPFIVTVAARNSAGGVTNNYRDTFAYGVTLSDANPAATPTGTFANNTIAPASFSSDSATNGGGFGVGSTEVANNFTYTFTTKETLPDVLDLRATDVTDTSISSAGFAEGTTEIRSGRTRVENSFGSELVDMAVTAQVEFYNSNGFEINTADTCSAVTATLTDIGTDPILVGTGLTGETCIWDDDAESGTDNCTNAAILPGPVSSQFESPTVAGSFNLFLLAPGANNTGDIGITLNSGASTWLQYDWDGDGNHDNDPTGVASFGLYRGDDRIIYWREVF